MRFLRENWAWILAPIVIVVLIIAAIFLFSESDPLAPQMYNTR